MPAQRERLDMRLDAEQKHRLERAAELSGQTLTAFVLDSAPCRGTNPARSYPDQIEHSRRRGVRRGAE